MGNAEKPYRRAITTWPSRGPHNYALPRPRPLLIHDLSMPLRRRSFDPLLRPPRSSLAFTPLGNSREALAAFARTQVSIQTAIRTNSAPPLPFTPPFLEVLPRLATARMSSQQPESSPLRSEAGGAKRSQARSQMYDNG